MSNGNSLRPIPGRFMAVAAIVMIALSLSCVGLEALAQHNGGGPPGGGGPPLGGLGGGQGPFDRPNGYPNSNPNDAPQRGSSRDHSSGAMHGGLQLGPPGRWWSDDRFARTLGLDRDQQHRMDDIFKMNKSQLVERFKALRHEESQLEKVSRARVLDEAQIDAQIDKVVQARGELEKANAHMLLEIRKQMTPEQTGRLDDYRPAAPPNDN